jgi:hypothetical protein
MLEKYELHELKRITRIWNLEFGIWNFLTPNHKQQTTFEPDNSLPEIPTKIHKSAWGALPFCV